jgi:hypothetical protein
MNWKSTRHAAARQVQVVAGSAGTARVQLAQPKLRLPIEEQALHGRGSPGRPGIRDSFHRYHRHP